MKQENGKPVHPLSTLRKEKGLTQADLGLLIDTQAQSIAQVEGGYRPLSNKQINSLMIRFNISPADLKQQLNDYKKQRIEHLVKQL